MTNIEVMLIIYKTTTTTNFQTGRLFSTFIFTANMQNLWAFSFFHFLQVGSERQTEREIEMEEKKTSFANGYYLWANANYIFIFSFFFRRTEFMFIYFFLSVLRHKEWVFILFTAAVGGVTLAAASAAVAEELRKERYNTTKYI